MSIEKMPPIVSRGLLLDVAGYKGVDMLPPAYAIGADDIRGALARQGSVISENTAVLVRTGTLELLRAGDPVYRDAQAGLNLEAAQFLFEQGMTLVGADNMAVEAMPPMDHSVHRFLLVHKGVSPMSRISISMTWRRRAVMSFC